MKEGPINTLTEFQMHNPDDAAFALIAHLIVILETKDESDLEHTWRNVNNILGEIESRRMLQTMCRLMHVDYLELMQKCQAITLRRVSPRLLLHLAVLPVTLVSEKLQVDQYWASQLLEEFHRQFTIDDPILWLKRFLAITEEERMRYSKEKHDLLMGRAIVGTPRDTAEYRRANILHRLRPRLTPPEFEE